MKTLLQTDPEVFEDDEVIIYEDFETLKEMFSYKIRPTPIHKEILTQMAIYVSENEKFMKRKNIWAARRARKALLRLYHLTRARRIEMLDSYTHPDFRERDFK